MAILRRYTPLVEQISIDEAFLDVAGTEALHGPPGAIARSIKEAITGELDLTASVGVAATRLVAKIASDLRKPDGLVIVPAGEEEAFLAPLPIARLWGVGAKSRAVLAEYGVRTIGDLVKLPPDLLQRRFGSMGPVLHDRARGIDPTPVSDGEAAKSVSHEHTFDRDTNDWEVIERTLLALAEGVAGRLRAGGVKAGTIGVKIRDSGFDTHTRQRTLPEPTDQTDRIWHTAVELTRPNVRGKTLRLLGVSATHLAERQQLSLFGGDERAEAATRAMDEIRKRFGSKAITRARLLESGVAEPFERDHLHAPEANRVGRARPPRDDPG
jgi:DNA polymerase-4